MYEVDSQGFVHQFNEGASHSVNFGYTRYSKGNTILHNHPSGSNLSPTDLRTFANTKQKAISAVGNKNTYTITKGTHFNSTKFLTGLNKAKAKSSDYTKEADKWLKDNQKKYGYTYTKEKTKIK